MTCQKKNQSQLTFPTTSVTFPTTLTVPFTGALSMTAPTPSPTLVAMVEIVSEPFAPSSLALFIVSDDEISFDLSERSLTFC
jgi:hypothetical protein